MASRSLEFEADLEICLEREVAIRITDDGGTLVANVLSNRFLLALRRLASAKLSIPGVQKVGLGFIKSCDVPCRYQLKSVDVAEFDPQAPPSWLLRLAGLGNLPIRIYPWAFLRAWFS
ncbi:MAG: hypothetical protein AAGK14_04520 [Verrucomicrobiota bacterium]